MFKNVKFIISVFLLPAFFLIFFPIANPPPPVGAEINAAKIDSPESAREDEPPKRAFKIRRFLDMDDPGEAAALLKAMAEEKGIDLNAPEDVRQPEEKDTPGQAPADLIRLFNGIEFIPGPGVEAGLSELVQRVPAKRREQERVVCVLQIREGATLGNVVELLEQRVKLYDTTGRRSHIVRLPAAAVDRLARRPFVRWIGQYRPEYKYDPVPSVSRRPYAFIYSLGGDRPEYRADMDRLGITVRHYDRSAGMYVAELGVERFPELARELWWARGIAKEQEIELLQVGWPVSLEPDDSREIIGAFQTSYTGSGVKVGVYDSGLWGGNDLDFPAGSVTRYDSNNVEDASGHGTHVSGILAARGGRDIEGTHDAKGVAPGAEIYIVKNTINTYSQAFSWFNSSSVQISNHSWAFTDDYSYNSSTENIDGYADDDDMILIVAAGNDANVIPSDRTIRNPGTGKNVITVGNIRYATDDSFVDRQIGGKAIDSSQGPTRDDSRLKPDLVAPGGQMHADHGYWKHGVVSTNNSDNRDDIDDAWQTSFWYVRMSGTSMAAPHVAGVAAKVKQWDSDISSELMKALLINTAIPLKQNASGSSGEPNTLVGYGMVNAVSVTHSEPGEEQRLLYGEGSVDEDDKEDTWIINVPAGTERLCVTMAYDDEEGEDSDGDVLKDDLELILIDPSSNETRHDIDVLPNINWSVTDESPLEKIIIDSPAAGNWTVKVLYTDGPGFGNPLVDGYQDYAVVAHAFLRSPELTLSVPAAAIDVLPGQSFTIDPTITNTGGWIAAGVNVKVAQTPGDGFGGDIDTTRYVGNLYYLNSAVTPSVGLTAPDVCGTYTLTVEADGINMEFYTGYPKTQTVTVNVEPAIAADPSTVATAARHGVNAWDQTFQVYNASDCGTVNYTITDDAGWFYCTPLTGDSTGPTDKDTITVKFDSTGLDPGTHTGTITITDSGSANSPYTVTVTLTVTPYPEIAFDPSSLSQVSFQGISPPPLSFQVWNSESGTLEYTVSEPAGWFSCDPDSGDSTGSDDKDTVSVIYTSSSYPPGTYEADITISDPEARNSPMTIPTSLEIRATPFSIERDGSEVPVNGSYDFGDLCLGSSETATFTIRNPGTDAYFVGVSFTCPISFCSFSSFPDSSILIPGGESADFDITFDPLVIGQLSATVQVFDQLSGTVFYQFTVTGTSKSCPVKFRGVVKGYPDMGGAVGVGGANILVKEVIDDMSGELAFGQTATVSWTVYPPFDNVRAEKGSWVEVSGLLSRIELAPGDWSNLGDHWVLLTSLEHHLKKFKLWHVNGSKVISGNGKSWRRAFRTIQEGIDAAWDPDFIHDVWVKKGEYRPGSNPVRVYRPVHLLGGFRGNETYRTQRDHRRYRTIVDGEGANQCFVVTADAVVDGFIIQNCKADEGGGMLISTPAGSGDINPLVVNCAFTGNNAINNGGGLFVDSAGPDIHDCLFAGNSASSFGGGMRIHNSAGTMSNCSFTGNSADYGGGIASSSSSTVYTNCTLSGNSAGTSGGGLYSGNASSPAIFNSIFWGNSVDEIHVTGASSVDLNYSDIQGGWSEGVGNMNEDPSFVNPLSASEAPTEDGDYHLRHDSPCVDAGSAAAAPPTDLEGDPRPQGSGYDLGSDETLLLGNGSFEYGDPVPDLWTGNKLKSNDVVVSGRAVEGSRSFRIAGRVNSSKSLQQSIDVAGKAGDVITISGWSMSVRKRQKGIHQLLVKLYFLDGTTKKYRKNFPKTGKGWKYRKRSFASPKDYNKIEVQLRYARQTGKAWFDDVRLWIE